MDKYRLYTTIYTQNIKQTALCPIIALTQKTDKRIKKTSLCHDLSQAKL